jgi:hypothetical protein
LKSGGLAFAVVALVGRRAARGAAIAALIALVPTATGHAQTRYEGFGATTPGGEGGEVVRVTTLDDAGPGSLREALSAGNRTIVFDVAGDIVLESELFVLGSFITIDGFTAPPPGITLRNRGLVIRGNLGAHDVIVRGVRVRDAAIDGLQIAYGAHHVVVDHVSIHGSGDGNLDITEGSHDVSVSWMVLAEPAGLEKNVLIKYDASRVTLHHNVLVGALQRNPQVRQDDAGTPATTTTADIRNNVVWGWGTHSGTVVWYGARANVVNNLYGNPGAATDDQASALIVCQGECDGNPASAARVHARGNVSVDGIPDLDAAGNEAAEFEAAPVDTEDACSAARRAIDEAGMRPLDPVDQAYLATIVLTVCTPGPSPLAIAFTTPGAGDQVQGSTAVTMTATGGPPVSYSVAVDGLTVYTGTSATFTWDTSTTANGARVLTATATDASGGIATDSITVTVSNPPTLAIAAPADGATVSGAVAVMLTSAPATGLTYEVAIGGATVYVGTSPTFSWDSTTATNGPTTITATATDPSGARASRTITVTVANLAAAFTTPASDATVSGTVTVGMAVSGPVTMPVTYRLRLNGVALSTKTVRATSTSVSWNTMPYANTEHTLALTATDAAGRTASVTRTVRTANATGLKVTFQAPAAGATVTGAVPVTVAVQYAAPGTGTLILTVGGKVQLTQAASGTPVTVSWNSRAVANGTRTLVVKVTDATGRTGSASRSVTVRN